MTYQIVFLVLSPHTRSRKVRPRISSNQTSFPTFYLKTWHGFSAFLASSSRIFDYIIYFSFYQLFIVVINLLKYKIKVYFVIKLPFVRQFLKPPYLVQSFRHLNSPFPPISLQGNCFLGQRIRTLP